MNSGTAPPVAIRFINVKKHFKDRHVEALGGIDLEVAQLESGRWKGTGGENTNHYPCYTLSYFKTTFQPAPFYSPVTFRISSVWNAETTRT
jgi:hypothetical protein